MAEPEERKTLYRVFELLARFDDTVKLMEATLHRLGADGNPETHPEVRRAAQSYAAYHDKLRAGIKATAESYLGVFADPLVQQNTSASTLRVSDLMCADQPVTLYLCWPPNDSKRVKPLMRLVFGAVLRDLMEHQERAADGRAKKRPLLLLLDEFPQLGKLDLFEQSMGAMAGYGVRAFIVTQSLHQVTQAYGRYHTILDGWSIALRGMPGTDASGASGVRDTVDAHLSRIAVASLLSGALSVAANEAESDDSNRLTESVGNAAAQEAARVGGRIIERELSVRPTLRIRAGAPVRVLVSQDIVLRPYPR